jgi:pimeloyl-ACP methyl ester carboxylesterase
LGFVRDIYIETKSHDMNKHIISSLSLAIVMMLMISCQQNSKEEQNPSTKTQNVDSSQGIKPTESGYADINGLKMYYEVYGQGKPLVLLHGAFMTIPLNWSKFIPRLAKDHKIIVAEMQGHGRTKDISRNITYEGMADDVSGLLKHLKIDSADILGYSMGGGIAFQFAVRHPEQLRRLIILSGTYAHDGWWPEGEASFANFKPEMFKGSAIEKQYDSLGNDPAHFPVFMKKLIAADLNKYDWSKEVKNIKAPIFMALGDADGVRYEHALELFRAKGGGKMGDIHGLPKSRLAILPGTTHVGMIQRADWLIPMITDFVDSDLNGAPPTF